MGIIGTLKGLAGGAIDMYTGLNNMYNITKAAAAQKSMLEKARATEDAWYRRNYYANYVDGSAAQAALKRVEENMRRRNQEAQARAVVNGATPEQLQAQKADSNKLMENVTTNLAANADARKMAVEAQHRAAENSLLGANMQQLRLDEQGRLDPETGTLQFIKNALTGANWGNQE